jgi:glutamate formiminotransferase
MPTSMLNPFSVMTAAKRFSHNMVACNVYVSAGQPHHAPMLLQLLEEAQDHCTRLQQQHQQQQHQPHDSKICMVHAYADGPYNRSSYHLAGTPSNVAAVASQLATNAAQALLTLEQQQQQKQKLPPDHSHAESTLTTTTITSTRHPTVGLVDHIAVMPLPSSTAAIPTSNDLLEPDWGLDEILRAGLLPPYLTELVIRQAQQTTQPNHNQELVAVGRTGASGWVARAIGHFLQQEVIGTQVLFYGQAHSNKTPLATVRRASTLFFQQSSKEQNQNHNHNHHQQQHQATVGAPNQFVENYNIRLSHRCSHSQAKTLTQWLRARDGGLWGVEALTLPYSQNRWEVACNLLQPHVVGASEIDQRVKEWELLQQQQKQKQSQSQQQSSNQNDNTSENCEALVEVAYRVGTTVEQCWMALDETSTGSHQQRDAYNQRVRERFQAFLSLLECSHHSEDTHTK